jgi:hypothetical protein
MWQVALRPAGKDLRRVAAFDRETRCQTREKMAALHNFCTNLRLCIKFKHIIKASIRIEDAPQFRPDRILLPKIQAAEPEQ